MGKIEIQILVQIKKQLNEAELVKQKSCNRNSKLAEANANTKKNNTVP